MKYLFCDGNNLAARNYYTNSELMDSQGRLTGLIFGFLRSLDGVKYATKIPTDRIVVFWDGGRSAKREELYPDYKAGRKLSDPQTEEDKREREEYQRQINLVRKILRTLPIRQIHVPGTEADDLIGIFANTAVQDGNSVVIFSGDQDMHQLAGWGVEIFDPKKGLLSLGDIFAIWGGDRLVEIPLKKAITGDSSDNIKGIHRVGDKRATQALRWCHIEGGHLVAQPIEEVDEKDKKWVQKVADNKEIVERNYLLVRIPRTWEESFYGWEQAVKACEQWLQQPSKDIVTFAKYLREYDLESILENLHHW